MSAPLNITAQCPAIICTLRQGVARVSYDLTQKIPRLLKLQGDIRASPQDAC